MADRQADVIASLDRAFLRLRRVMVKPVSAKLPVASLGRAVDLAKVMACQAIDEVPAESGAPTVKDVALALQLDHSTTSRLLGDAEAEGLVVRGGDPHDKRRTTVSLTDTGRAVVADSTTMRHWFMGQVLADWNPADIAQLADLLTRATRSFADRVPQVRAQAEQRFCSEAGLDAAIAAAGPGAPVAGSGSGTPAAEQHLEHEAAR